MQRSLWVLCAVCWQRLRTKDVNRVDGRGAWLWGSRMEGQFAVSTNTVFHYIGVTHLLPRN